MLWPQAHSKMPNGFFVDACCLIAFGPFYACMAVAKTNDLHCAAKENLRFVFLSTLGFLLLLRWLYCFFPFSLRVNRLSPQVLRLSLLGFVLLCLRFRLHCPDRRTGESKSERLPEDIACIGRPLGSTAHPPWTDQPVAVEELSSAASQN